MRIFSLAICLLSGCALVEDFDRYTAQRASGDAAEDTNEAPEEDALDIRETGDTTSPSIEDTGVIDTFVPDTAPSIDTAPPPTCAELCAAQGLKGATECTGGKCGCRSGATPCSGTCTYLDSDPLNCGGCGNKIADPTQTCGGACLPNLKTCNEWGYSTTCPVKCVDTSNEGNHCYQYSGTMTTFQRCYPSGACRDGGCFSGCTGGRKECVAPFRDGTDPNVRSCVDTLHDPNHCGGCSTACKVGEVCAEGSCKTYHPARSKDDCMGSQKPYTPYGWSKLVCLD